MRKILLTLAAFGAISTSNAAQLLDNNYQTLLQTLEQGEEVKAIIHFEKCVWMPGVNSQKDDIISGSLNFNVYSHYPFQIHQTKYDMVATSQTMLVNHHSFGPVYAYLRLRVLDNNDADVYAAYYDANTHEIKSATNYSCKLSNGHDDKAVTLYRRS